MALPETAEPLFPNTPTCGGLRVAFGSLPLLNESGKIHKTLLLCKVGIGRAFPLDSDPTDLTKDTLPPGYDSFYLIDHDYEAKRPPAYAQCEAFQKRIEQGRTIQWADYEAPGKTHGYYVFESAQLLPVYVVEVEFDPDRERLSRERPKCDNCENALAEVYCTADQANLCRSCDVQLHNNKLASRHQRTPVGKGADVFGHCPIHNDKLVEFFCSQCHIPVCIQCKMVGHHSLGEAARHKLVSAADAYQTVLTESKMPDGNFATKVQCITTQLANITTRAKNLEKHSQKIQTQIEDMFKKAMMDLKSITSRKMDILAGDKWELQRQLDEVSLLENFLQYQQTGDSTQFLFNWARHQQLRQRLHDFRFFRETIDVQLDIKCSGNVVVLAETSLIEKETRHQRKPSSASSVISKNRVGGMVGEKKTRSLSKKELECFVDAIKDDGYISE